MRYFAVYGEDQIFEGTYGYTDYKVKKFKDIAEALDYARDLSAAIIDESEEIKRILESNIKAICEEQKIPYGQDNEAEYIIMNEVYDNDLSYDCIELDITKLPTLDEETLTTLYSANPSSFLKLYALIKD